MTKEAVYAALAERDGYLSGSVLARTLGVSRNSIFKAVEQLRREGVPIEAAPNRGYRLLPEAALRAQSISARLETAQLGRNLEVAALLSSTNDVAKQRAADGAPHGTVIVADHQSAGRGRRGRCFFSPPGCGVYMSVILRDGLSAEKVGLLTSAAAVAVAEAIESFVPAAVQIKWVNDLLIDGKKICGILTEGSLYAENGEYEYAVLGIGINVGTVDFPPELETVATSIQAATGTAVDRAALIAAILGQLERTLATMEDGAFLAESRRRSAVLGKTVTVLQGNDRYPARAVEIDSQGRLVVETDAGRRTVLSGEVSLRL